MATLETYKDRFAESGWRIFERAISEAVRRGQKTIGVEHILYALTKLNAELFSSLLQSLCDNADAPVLLVELIEERVAAVPKDEGRDLRLASETIDLFKRTLSRVRSNVRQRIEATDLFVTLVMDERSLLRLLLQKLLTDTRSKTKQVRDLLAVVESANGRPLRRQDYKFLAGEMVRVRSGAFASFNGTVAEVDEEAATLKIAVFIMGREQPVEMKFVDVEKIDLNE